MRKTKALLTVGLTGLIATSIAAWRPEAPTKTALMRRNAVAWAKAHRQQLPSDYNTYVRFPAPYRQAIYWELSWPVREKLWREHLQAFLMPADSLSAAQLQTVQSLGQPLNQAQRAFVNSWVSTVVSRGYDPALTKEQRVALATPFCKNSKSVLGAAAYPVLAQIGPLDTTYLHMVAAEGTQKLNAASMFSVSAAKTLIKRAGVALGVYRYNELCFCSVSSLCSCPTDSYCWNSNCVQHGPGCGCGGFWQCDGSACGF